MTRLRKAWYCRIQGEDQGDLVFAETAGKARYKLLLSLQDICSDATFSDIIVHRERAADIELPDTHPMVSDLTDRQAGIVTHAFGVRPAGYREHYVTNEDDSELSSLVEKGLFTKGGRLYLPEGQIVFILTDLGKSVASSLQPTYPD
jgi:hypothetical protein